jgi:hypothetical protein
MKFTKTMVNGIAKEAEEVLQKHFAERGIAVQHKRGSFDSMTYDLKMSFTVKDEDGHTREEVDFLRWAGLGNKLTADMLGAEIGLGINRHKIVGWDEGRRKNVIVTEKLSDGKRYISSIDTIVYQYYKSHPGIQK